MQNVQELYITTISQMPPSERLKLAAMILTNLTNIETKSEQRQSVRQMVQEMPAGRLFKTSAEADQYLEQERDSWGSRR
ncbi:MAG: hypothetical protein JST85_17120 [Acidobacteria bacterium]|nr:hypothetical protein [Acidobacteriota bacterium]